MQDSQVMRPCPIMALSPTAGPGRCDVWVRPRSVVAVCAAREILRGMSRENDELLVRFYEAFNAERVEPMLAFVDPEFVYRTRDEFPGGGSYGLEPALERISALRELFDELRWEPQEFIDAGAHTLVVVRQIVRGRASGVMLDESIAHVWLIQDRIAKELRVYSQRSQALEAVGLSE